MHRWGIKPSVADPGEGPGGPFSCAQYNLILSDSCGFAALTGKKTKALVSLSVGLIFIFIGLPLWWNTTKVYRAPLPYDEIEQLNQFKV